MEIPRRTDFTIYLDKDFNIAKTIIDSRIDYSWKFYIIHAKYLRTSGIDGKGILDYFKYIVYKDSKETTLKTPHFSCKILTVESFIGEELQFRFLHYPIQYYNKNVFRFKKVPFWGPITKSFNVKIIEEHNEHSIEIIGNIYTLIALLKNIGTDGFELFLLKENILYLKELLIEIEKNKYVILNDYIDLIACLSCHVIKPIKQGKYYFSSIQERKQIESEVEKIENRINTLFLKVSQ